jgi:RND family efflux transporter MFP subunit
MTNNKKSRISKLIVPLCVVVITAALVYWIKTNPPESKRKEASNAPQMTVEVKKLIPRSYQVSVESFGTVAPRTQSVLFSQVSGQIIKVSPQFRDGGFFDKGDVLLELDDRDFRSEAKTAEAALIEAKQNYEEEKARGEQAITDWKRLGNGKEASDLVLRKPQLAATQAQVLSAEAQFEKANLALERTKIIAPYAGRILTKNVDIGQVVSSTTALADIYAADYVEIRLPIKNKDLALMKLPEEYINDANEDKALGNVVISSNLIGKQVWQGNIVRTESAIDEDSQQLYVVAQIDKPYESNNQTAQIKIGQYVTAAIEGKKVEGALVVPSSSIYQGSYVYIVEEGVLKRKYIEVTWQNGIESIIGSGLSAGDNLVITALGQINSGTRVLIAGEPVAPRSGPRNGKGKKGEGKKGQGKKGEGKNDKVNNS